MIPTSTGLERFTPRDKQGEAAPPVYLIGVPTVAGRARLRAAQVAEGLRWWAPGDFFAAARDFIEEVAPDNEAALLAVIARVEEDARAEPLAAPIEGEEPDPAALREAERRADTLVQWARLLEPLTQDSPRLARMEADNELFLSLAPYLAAALFLRGWENLFCDGGEVPFKLQPDGTVAMALLQQLPPEDIVAIWIRLTGLLGVSGPQRKNSASPSSSPATRTPSRAARQPRTAAPGTSSGKNTPATRP